MSRVIHRLPIKAMLHSRFALLLAAFLIILALIEIQVQNLQASVELLENSLHHINSRNLKEVESLPSPSLPTSKEDNPEDNLLVIYNRVPKTASTSLVGLAYNLCKKNNFHVLHINTTNNSHVMSVQDQMRYVWNTTHWNSRLPAFYHGHVAFINFDAFGSSIKPVYINVIRRPLDRLISFYSFLHHGDDYRPRLVRHRMSETMTFDECVVRGGFYCSPDRLWIQVPFFCGHSNECWKPGSRWALEQAKSNLLNRYLLVGVTEELEEFIAILEAAIPSMFKGALHLYRTGKHSHLRKTVKKEEPSEETLEVFYQSPVWQVEEEFYNFVLENFHAVKKRALVEDKEGHVTALDQQFMYEKVRPV